MLHRDAKILYIEDNQHLALLFQKVMARQGYQVDIATSGREGMELSQNTSFEVVVLDYHLPDMTGLDIAKQLLKSDSELDVVIVTGRGDEQTASEALAIGVSDYLVKDENNTFIEKLPRVVAGLLEDQERQRQEEHQRRELSESEARYRALIESSLQGIMVYKDNRPVFANQAYAEMHGYRDATEICALDSIQELLPTNEHEVYPASAGQVFGGKTWDHNHCGVRKDGGTVWLEIRGQQIDWEGSPAVQIVAVDTTGRHEAQLELEQREARFWALANMSSDWFWECDANLRITSVDGSHNIDSLRAGLGDLLSPDHADDKGFDKLALAQLRGHLLKYQPIRNLEFRTPSSPSFWLSISADPLFSGDGRFLGYYGTAQNIKGRKKAEQKLRERELILKKAQEVADLGSFYRNPETGETSWSEQLFRNYGRRPTRKLPDFLQALEQVHPDDRERVRLANQRLKNEGDECHHQYRVTWPNGEVHTLFANIVVERDMDGQLRQIGTVQDVSDRLAMENALLDSEAQLKAIQENLPAALSIKDEDGRFVYVNKQFRLRHQDPEADVIGLTAFDLFDEKIAKALQQHDNRLLREGVVSSEEIEMSWPDGSPLYVDNIKFPVVFGDKRFVGTISPDISRQKQAIMDLQRSEKLLQDSENYLQKLIQTANAPIISLDREFRITDWNKAAQDIIGYSRDEVLQSNFVDRLITEDMQKQVKSMLVDDLEDEHISNARITMLTKSGKIATIMFSTTGRIGKNGQVDGIVCIGQDVTPLILAQDQLSQSQKMEAVGQLTGGVAHDFNNLLQIISGSATMLNELRESDRDLAKWIKQIEEAVKRGSSLTSQLLAFSRQQNLSPEVVRPGEVILEIKALLQRTLGEDIRWNILISDFTSPVFADQHALQNAVINLCVNSRSAMQNGGEMTIKVADVEVVEAQIVDDDIVEAGSFVEISVSDNGGGMTAETLKHAVNPFFSTKSVGEGTGLGLSMVYGFSRQSGGLTRIESEVGVGTRVSILLPATSRPVEGEEPGKTIDEEKQKRVVGHQIGNASGPILVVEDNVDVRIATCAMLKISGYESVEADDANKALQILAQRPDIDMIFSDVVMPGGMSGFDLAQKLSEKNRKYKVLLTSGYPDKLSQESSAIDRSIQIIAKPFTLKELESALGNLRKA